MKFITIFLLILLPIAARSQVEVGVRSGVAFSKQKFEVFGYPSELSNSIVGIDAGVMLNWFFLHNLSLQPELSFIQKGGAYPNGTNKINHLELAALLGFERKSGQLSVFVNSGVFLDKVLNTPKDGYGPLAPYPPNGFEYNNWGWGLIHSGGSAIQVGKGWIGLVGRYRYSLNYFRDVDGTDINDDPGPILNLRNKGWSINLYYKIDIH
jgi:hypothetical protein